MEWFQGTILEAIQSSKTRKAYFVVYIEGTDDASKTTTEVLDRPALSSKLNSTEFVCIKLPKDSEGHKQFAEIYKMVPAPSVFFIAQNGQASDVVIGKTDGTSVETLLSTAIEKCSATLKEANGASALPAPQPTVSVPNNLPAGAASSVSPQPSSSNLTSESSTALKTEQDKEADKPAVSDQAKAPPPLDERVEKAKQLINQKNEQKQKEDIEKEKAAERERRRVGQELHKAKMNRQDQEMKEALEERRKNALQDQAARKRILDQIAQDRADRLQRERARAPVVSPPAASTVPAPSVQNGDSARIQFRLPTGETKTHVFQANTTISQIRQFIDSNIDLPFSEYHVATTFPRREFTWRDNEQDLASLELLPSAVLLILPVSGKTVSQPNVWITAMISFFWSIVTPIMNLGNYITSFITGGGQQRRTTSPEQPDNPQQPSAPSSSSQSSPQPPYGSRTTIRKRGNIHTLADDSENPDDNNTWNGNSTQQM